MERSYESRFDAMWDNWESKSYAKCLSITKSSFQLMKRIEAADLNGIVVCCSCGVTGHYKRMDGGHFIPATSTATVFWEYPSNVNPQCKYCNHHRQGNLIKYREFMVERYGEVLVRELEEMKGYRKWEIWELIDLRIGFMDRIKAAKSRLTDGS